MKMSSAKSKSAKETAAIVAEGQLASAAAAKRKAVTASVAAATQTLNVLRQADAAADAALSSPQVKAAVAAIVGDPVRYGWSLGVGAYKGVRTLGALVLVVWPAIGRMPTSTDPEKRARVLAIDAKSVALKRMGFVALSADGTPAVFNRNRGGGSTTTTAKSTTVSPPSLAEAGLATLLAAASKRARDPKLTFGSTQDRDACVTAAKSLVDLIGKMQIK